MTRTRRQFPRWVKRGIAGAVIVPVAYVGLAILQSLVPYGSAAYKVVHGMVWGIVAPVIMPIEKMGMYGCAAMAYIVPIFLLVALYLGAIGFGIGSLTASLGKGGKESHNQKVDPIN